MTNLRPLAPKSENLPVSLAAKSVTKRSRHQYDAARWEAMKPTIVQLFIQEKKTADEVVDILKRDPSDPFIISRRQLFVKLNEWGIKRNGKKRPRESEGDSELLATSAGAPVESLSYSDSLIFSCSRPSLVDRSSRFRLANGFAFPPPLRPGLILPSTQPSYMLDQEHGSFFSPGEFRQEELHTRANLPVIDTAGSQKARGLWARWITFWTTIENRPGELIGQSGSCDCGHQLTTCLDDWGISVKQMGLFISLILGGPSRHWLPSKYPLGESMGLSLFRVAGMLVTHLDIDAVSRLPESSALAQPPWPSSPLQAGKGREKSRNEGPVTIDIVARNKTCRHRSIRLINWGTGLSRAAVIILHGLLSGFLNSAARLHERKQSDTPSEQYHPMGAPLYPGDQQAPVVAAEIALNEQGVILQPPVLSRSSTPFTQWEPDTTAPANTYTIGEFNFGGEVFEEIPLFYS